MKIEDLADRITPGIAIGDFDSALRKLLRLVMEEEEIVAYYHRPGRFTPENEGFKTDQPGTLCILTRNRIHKIDIQIEEGKTQVFCAASHSLEDVTSYGIDAAAMMDSPGQNSWLAVRGFSLSFRNGEKIELYCDKRTESNPLQEFAESVLQQIR